MWHSQLFVPRQNQIDFPDKSFIEVPLPQSMAPGDQFPAIAIANFRRT